MRGHLGNRASDVSSDIFGQSITAIMTHQQRIGMVEHHVPGFAGGMPAPQCKIDESPATYTPITGMLTIVKCSNDFRLAEQVQNRKTLIPIELGGQTVRLRLGIECGRVFGKNARTEIIQGNIRVPFLGRLEEFCLNGIGRATARDLTLRRPVKESGARGKGARHSCTWDRSLKYSPTPRLRAWPQLRCKAYPRTTNIGSYQGWFPPH